VAIDAVHRDLVWEHMTLDLARYPLLSGALLQTEVALFTSEAIKRGIDLADVTPIFEKQTQEEVDDDVRA
jgi:hypothetical protein